MRNVLQGCFPLVRHDGSKVLLSWQMYVSQRVRASDILVVRLSDFKMNHSHCEVHLRVQPDSVVSIREGNEVSDFHCLHAVATVKLTDKGKPRIILADGSAYVLDLGLQTWQCVVDPAFAFTAFASLLPDAAAKAGKSTSKPILFCLHFKLGYFSSQKYVHRPGLKREYAKAQDFSLRLFSEKTTRKTLQGQ